MSFEIADLCKFYFNITDPNDNKAFEHSNQVRKLFFKEKRRRGEEVGSLPEWNKMKGGLFVEC